VRGRAISIPLALRVGGDALDRSVDAILAALAGGPFIFNLATASADTPVAHVEQMLKRVRSIRGGEAGYPPEGARASKLAQASSPGIAVEGRRRYARL